MTSAASTNSQIPSTAAGSVAIKNAPTPFDHVDADIILRSRTNVDFRVFKLMLGLTSSFFKAMFTLPQEGTFQETKDGLHVITLEEDEEMLELLLKYCYPRWSAVIEDLSLEKLIKLLEVANKYGMDSVESHLRAQFVAERFIATEPFRVWAIALRCGLEREARIAAQATLRLPILGRPYIQEMEHITAASLHRLQVYHQECAEIASKVAKNLEWMAGDSYAWFECNTDCRNPINGLGQAVQVTLSGGRRKWVTSKWWWDYMAQAVTSLGEKPSGATVTSPELVDAALMKASQCGTCRSRAFQEMRAFTKEFALEIDKSTAAVRFLIIR